MANPDTIDYSHGDTGERPPDGEDFQSGETANPETHDWLFYTIPRKIDAIIDRLNILDSDGDGVVDEADFANDADASTYKGNDIDTSGNGVVDQAAQATAADDADTLDGNEGSHYLLDVEDGGVTVATDVTGIDGGDNVGITDNGDGTVTLSTTIQDTDTHVGVDDDGTAVINEPDSIDFGSNLNVVNNGDGSVTVSTPSSVDFADKADEAKRFEARTSYPSNPVSGQVVFRTDKT